MKNWIALAAMAENRVIGNGAKIPWHLPEDFKWFKAKTIGQIVVMGRKTFESIGKPLPKRETIVISRQKLLIPGTTVLPSISALESFQSDKQVIICGGAEIYRQALPNCTELFMTHVFGEYPGDILFPPFESEFLACATIRQTAEFKIVHYKRM